MAQPVLAQGDGLRQPLVVALDPARLSADAEQPRRSVGSLEDIPAPIARTGEIAVVGAQGWQRIGGGSEADRQSRMTMQFGNGRRQVGTMARRRQQAGGRGPFQCSLDRRPNSLNVLAHQQVVEVVTLPRRHGDPHPAALGVQTGGGDFGGTKTCGIMVGEDDDPAHVGGQHHLLQADRRQCRPRRQGGHRVHDGPRGLDALTQPQEAIGGRRQADGAAGHRPQHLARLGHRRLR